MKIRVYIRDWCYFTGLNDEVKTYPLLGQGQKGLQGFPKRNSESPGGRRGRSAIQRHHFTSKGFINMTCWSHEGVLLLTDSDCSAAVQLENFKQGRARTPFKHKECQ